MSYLLSYYVYARMYVHTTYYLFLAWRDRLRIYLSPWQIYSNRINFTCSCFSSLYIRELVLDNKAQVSRTPMWDILGLASEDKSNPINGILAPNGFK